MTESAAGKPDEPQSKGRRSVPPDPRHRAERDRGRAGGGPDRRLPALGGQARADAQVAGLGLAGRARQPSPRGRRGWRPTGTRPPSSGTAPPPPSPAGCGGPRPTSSRSSPSTARTSAARCAGSRSRSSSCAPATAAPTTPTARAPPARRRRALQVQVQDRRRSALDRRRHDADAGPLLDERDRRDHGTKPCA